MEQHPTEHNGWQMIEGQYTPIRFDGEQLLERLIPPETDLKEIDCEIDDDMEVTSSDDACSSEDDD